MQHVLAAEKIRGCKIMLRTYGAKEVRYSYLPLCLNMSTVEVAVPLHLHDGRK